MATTDERIGALREQLIGLTSDLRQRRLAADFDDTARADAKVELIEQAEGLLDEAAEKLRWALLVEA